VLRLDEAGNSVKAQKVIEYIVRKLDDYIFLRLCGVETKFSILSNL
jgi:hypothetical protein